ncbi:MAG: caspase family protein [Planctomycetes bacterium]|nr:caspase family protein [Planctomycetota bacterium]
MNQWHFAVVVGINQYPDIRDLKFAKGDAEEFAKWLEDPQGGALLEDNIAKVVADVPDGTLREDAIPTRTEVIKELRKFRDKVDAHIKENPDDWELTRLYFYVSGHGIAPDPRDAALLMANSGPEDYGENIACSLLLDFLLKNQPFHEVVVFADCCRERVNGAPLVGFPWTNTERNNGQVLKVVGCATYFGDLAYEPSEEEAKKPDELRGYFTKALLEGLRGNASRNDAGYIDSNTLGQYVVRRVGELTSHRANKQVPTIEADTGNPIKFGKTPEAGPQNIVKHQARLKFVTPYNGIVELRDGDNAVIVRHNTADGDWVVELPNGLYRVTPENKAGGVVFRDKGFFEVWGDKINVEL